MTFGGRTRNTDDRKRLVALHDPDGPGCIPCLILWHRRKRLGPKPCCGRVTEQHSKGRTRKGAHQQTYPSGSWHHLGEVHEGWLKSSMYAEYGPSLFHHKREFLRVFGPESGLVAIFNAEMAGEEWGVAA